MLRRAGAVRLLGLVDPTLPALPSEVRACLADVFPNAYAASVANPDAFVDLGSGDDRLFAAKLILDPALPSLGLVQPRAPGLAGAIERYWRSYLDDVVDEDELWTRAASTMPKAALADGMAVLTTAPTAPLCLALQRLGADVFGPETVAAIAPNYRRALFLLANTAADSALLGLLRRFGGDAVLADPCLLAAYDDEFCLRLASAELDRPVPLGELQQWRAGVARPAALLLGDVAASSSRLFVTSAWLANELTTRFSRTAIVLPPISDGRQVAAQAAGLWAECCVWAVEMLASWGETVRLDLACPEPEQPGLQALAKRLGVADRIGFGGTLADIGLFLAMRGEASRSGALAQATGLPCVASLAVAEGVDVVCAAVLPDQPSPPLLAEALLRLLPRESAADRAAALIYRTLA